MTSGSNFVWHNEARSHAAGNQKPRVTWQSNFFNPHPLRLSLCPSVCPSVTFSCPLHISWTLWKIFIKVLSNVRLSESMCRTHKSTMPTQGQGYGIEPWISCPLHISFTPGGIFFKLWSYVCLSETMCKTYNHADTMSRSQFKVTGLSLKFRVRSVSPIPVEGFPLNVGQMFTLVRRGAESITTMLTQGQGHCSRSWVWALNFVSALYLLYPCEDFL